MLSARAAHIGAETHYYPTKTPARGVKNRSENAYQGAMTIQNGKGKANIMRTPFQPKTAQPQRLLKDVPGSTKAPIHFITRPTRPLADKTPFANRVLNVYNTPAPDQKPLKALNTNKHLEPPGPTPESGSTRPSSTRKHPRAPRSAGNNFQTPANQGNHWDVSEGEIVVPEMEQVEEVEEVIDDGDEIEYMAPNTQNLAYQPPFDFDLPNYKVLGEAVLRSVYSYPDVELPPPTFDFQISDNDFMKWDALSLPSLTSDDEPSRPSKRTQPTSTRTTMKPITSKAVAPATARVTSRPATSASIRRPATSASSRAPTVKPTSTIRPASTATIRAVTTSRTHTITASTTLKPNTLKPTLRATAPKQPLTRPTPSTRPATTQSVTTARTRAATTTRTASRPATSASTRPLTSASVRSIVTSSVSTVRPAAVTKSKSNAGTGPTKKPIESRVVAPPAAARVRSATIAMAKTPVTKPVRSKVTGVKPTGPVKAGVAKPGVIEAGNRQLVVKECPESAREEGEEPLGEGAVEEVKGLKHDREEESPLQEEAVADVGVTEAPEGNTTAPQEELLQVRQEMSVTIEVIGDPQVPGQNVVSEDAITTADVKRMEIALDSVNTEGSKDLDILHVEGEEQSRGGFMD